MIEDDVKECVEVMKKGGLILYPTDTIWGIGCDATNAEAVKKVYELKQRADNKALIVLLDSVEHLDHYVVNVPEMAYLKLGSQLAWRQRQRGYKNSARGVQPQALRMLRQAGGIDIG